jgi:hypothetical protein
LFVIAEDRAGRSAGCSPSAAPAWQQLVVVLTAWQPEVAAVPVVLQEAAVAVAFARPAAVVGPAAAVAAALVVPQQAGSARGPPAAPAPRASAAAVSRVVVEAAPIASRPVMAACVLQAGAEVAKPCSSRRKAEVRREEEVVAACRSWCLGPVTVVWSGRPLHPPGSWPTECLTMVVACRSSAVVVVRRVHRAKVVRSACRSGSEVRCQARPLLRVRGAVCQSARAGHSMPDWSSSRVARCRALSAG